MQTPAPAEPFALNVESVTAGPVLSKWNGVVADIRAESNSDALPQRRAPCPAAARNFLNVIADGRAREGRARIGVINRAINLAIQPMTDLAQWGVADRWSAPLDTLTTGRGDCEDYAIAKYVALGKRASPRPMCDWSSCAISPTAKITRWLPYGSMKSGSCSTIAA